MSDKEDAALKTLEFEWKQLMYQAEWYGRLRGSSTTTIEVPSWLWQKIEACSVAINSARGANK